MGGLRRNAYDSCWLVVGWRTHAYLQMVEEFHRNTNNAQNSGADVEIQPNQRSNSGVSLGSTSSLPVEDVESVGIVQKVC